MTSVLFWLFLTYLAFPTFFDLWWIPIFQELYDLLIPITFTILDFDDDIFFRIFQHRHSSVMKVNMLITILLPSTIYYPVIVVLSQYVKRNHKKKQSIHSLNCTGKDIARKNVQDWTLKWAIKILYITYRTGDIITRFWLKTALEY